MSLLAPLPPPCWPQNYLARVSGGFRGFAKWFRRQLECFRERKRLQQGAFWRTHGSGYFACRVLALDYLGGNGA